MTTKPASKKADPTNKRDHPQMIHQELEDVLHLAFVDARARRHEFITVEHLLLALAKSSGTAEILQESGADVDELKKVLNIFIEENTPTVGGKEEVDTQPTLGFQRVIQRAIMTAQGKQISERQVLCHDALVAIFGEKDSQAVYLLHQQGVTRLDVMEFISLGKRKHHEGLQSDSKSQEEAESIAVDRDLSILVSKASQPYVSTSSRTHERPKLFISYSHADTACLDRLLVHLKPLERANTVVAWSDRRIRTGDKWKVELEQTLDDAVIAILLVSADFLASDFIVNNELPPLLIKADAKGLRILPVVLKPCGFRRDPVLSTFQAVNDPVIPLLGMSLMEQESIYDKIADEVAKEIVTRSK